MASEAVRAVLNQVWSALEPLKIPCVLTGGLALAAWSHPRATRDVDLLIGVDSAHIQPILDALQAIGCRPKKSPPLIRVGELSFVHLLYTPPGEFYDVQFDLLLTETAFQKSALVRCVERTIPGVDRPIHVLNCDDLILFKLVAGRMIDRADAAMLLRENREAIDFQYLADWLGELQLSQDFGEVWQEAFPGEASPVAGLG